MFGKRRNLEFQCLKKPKFKNPMIEKGKIYMPNVWKEPKFRIPMFEKAKV